MESKPHVLGGDNGESGGWWMVSSASYGRYGYTGHAFGNIAYMEINGIQNGLWAFERNYAGDWDVLFPI